MAKNAKDDLQERLKRHREIKLTVVGRKSGKEISVPVWFVFENEKLYLLPVHGSDTQWYRNVQKNPSIHIAARELGQGFRAKSITESQPVKTVVEKFREKYGASDVKKYYTNFDVAVVAEAV